MCGIFLAVQNHPIESFQNVQKHRGPDFQKSLALQISNRHLFLHHNRLSIIDTSEDGIQPFSSTDKSKVIVFNGEIYNYLELKEELTLLGHKFTTATDTEVLLTAYQEWGSACLEKLNGMFAFAIVDHAQKKVFLARDRYGIKPLYYYQDQHRFYVASEIKQILAMDVKPIANLQLIKDFVDARLFDHTEETFFKNVYQLRGGECAEFDLNQLQFKKSVWYQLKDKAHPLDLSFKEATQQFRELFEDSIKLRLRADVPVGSCLSGGLDSSSIVCVANQQLRAQGKSDLQNTFFFLFR